MYICFRVLWKASTNMFVLIPAPSSVEDHGKSSYIIMTLEMHPFPHLTMTAGPLLRAVGIVLLEILTELMSLRVCM